MIGLQKAIDAGAESVSFYDACGFHKKQRLACEATLSRKDPLVLAGGSGFGGKSYMLRAWAVMWQLRRRSQGLPPVPILFCSGSYETLRDRHFEPMVREWGSLGELKSSDKTYGRAFVFNDPGVGAIVFRNLANPNERKGSEFGGAAIDEITEITQDQFGAVLYMIRSPICSTRPILAATNPDGVGHNWVKGVWRPTLAPTEFTSLEELTSFPGRQEPFSTMSGEGMSVQDPLDYIYVPFLPDDNPAFDETMFWRMVAHLPPHVQRARRYGLWDAPEGARFPTVSAATHIFNRYDKWPAGIPDYYKVILSTDYGIRAPYCALWTVIDEAGDLWTYREDYRAGLPAHEQAKAIVEKTKANEVIDLWGLDPAMWQQSRTMAGDKEPSAADIYEDYVRAHGGGRFPSPSKGYNRSRVIALSTLDKLLGRDNGFPDWHIDQSCVNLFSELTGAVYKVVRPGEPLVEDIDPRCPDHAITSAYYGFHNWLSAAKNPLNQGGITHMIQAGRAITAEDVFNPWNEEEAITL